jgi:hypothetical protein
MTLDWPRSGDVDDTHRRSGMNAVTLIVVPQAAVEDHADAK